jgi:hypothetical protein
MYLIIKDPKAGTVRVEFIDPLLYFMKSFARTLPAGFVEMRSYHYDAEATAKSIAIKENLVYTPQIEY